MKAIVRNVKVGTFGRDTNFSFTNDMFRYCGQLIDVYEVVSGKYRGPDGFIWDREWLIFVEDGKKLKARVKNIPVDMMGATCFTEEMARLHGKIIDVVINSTCLDRFEGEGWNWLPEWLDFENIGETLTYTQWQQSADKWAKICNAIVRNNIDEIQSGLAIPCSYCKKYCYELPSTITATYHPPCSNCPLYSLAPSGIRYCENSTSASGVMYWKFYTMVQNKSCDYATMFDLASSILARILQTKFHDEKVDKPTYQPKVVISKEKPANGDAGVYLEQLGDEVWLKCDGWVLAAISINGIRMGDGVGKLPIATKNGKVVIR